MKAVEYQQALAASPDHRGGWLPRVTPVALVSADAAMVIIAFLLAYWLRYTAEVGPQIQQRVAIGRYAPLAALLLAIILPVLMIKGAYTAKLGRELVDDMVTVFSAATISVAGLVVITTMLHQYDYSRGLVLYLWAFLIVLLASARAAWRAFQRLCYRRGWGVRQLLVVGASDAGKMVMQSVMNRPDLGYQLAGFVETRGIPYVRDFGRFRGLGTVSDIPELVESGLVDEIIIALPASEHEEVAPILGLCERHGVGLKLVPDLFEMSLGRVQMDDIAGIPLLDVKDRPLRRFERAVKRTVDIAVSACLVVLTFPLVLLIAALVRLESGSPVFLEQDRVGLGGRTFRCLKFRTMRTDAEDLRASLDAYNEADGPLFKMRDDPRCTPLGKRLRRWSLDELPQALNVLRGEMSLVGPRPPLVEEANAYDDRQARRLEVKPGMTGIWQVSGRSDLGFDEMVMMDLYYVDNWSLALDARILLRTISAVLRRHGAY